MQASRKSVLPLFIFALLILGSAASSVMAAGNAEAGGKVYQMRCSPCHGADGKAATPTAQALNPKPRDHSDGTYMNKLTHDHLTAVIKNGGVAVGKSQIMPPHTDLSTQQIDDVIAFVRTLAMPPYSEK